MFLNLLYTNVMFKVISPHNGDKKAIKNSDIFCSNKVSIIKNKIIKQKIKLR